MAGMFQVGDDMDVEDSDDMYVQEAAGPVGGQAPGGGSICSEVGEANYVYDDDGYMPMEYDELPPGQEYMPHYGPGGVPFDTVSEFSMPELAFERAESVDIVYQPTKPPKVYGRYLFGDKIGEGSYGKVKDALDIITLQKYAVKIIRTNRLKRITNGVDNVRKEIKLLKRLNHPNVIRLHDVLYNHNKLKTYMFLEYCVDSLQDMLEASQEGRLPEWQAHEYIVQLFHALDYIHSRGIIHRDIKPGNLLISLDNVLKLTDFGVADCIDMFNHQARCTTSCGTPVFQCPQIAAGAEDFDGPKSDVWAAGVTLWNLVSGDYPFFHQNVFQLYTTIVEKALEIPPEIAAFPLLTSLLQNLLAKNEDERFSVQQALSHPWSRSSHDQAEPPVPAGSKVPDIEENGLLAFLDVLFPIDEHGNYLRGSQQSLPGIQTIVEEEESRLLRGTDTSHHMDVDSAHATSTIDDSYSKSHHSSRRLNESGPAASSSPKTLQQPGQGGGQAIRGDTSAQLPHGRDAASGDGPQSPSRTEAWSWSPLPQTESSQHVQRFLFESSEAASSATNSERTAKQPQSSPFPTSVNDFEIVDADQERALKEAGVKSAPAHSHVGTDVNDSPSARGVGYRERASQLERRKGETQRDHVHQQLRELQQAEHNHETLALSRSLPESDRPGAPSGYNSEKVFHQSRTPPRPFSLERVGEDRELSPHRSLDRAPSISINHAADHGQTDHEATCDRTTAIGTSASGSAGSDIDSVVSKEAFRQDSQGTARGPRSRSADLPRLSHQELARHPIASHFGRTPPGSPRQHGTRGRAPVPTASQQVWQKRSNSLAPAAAGHQGFQLQHANSVHGHHPAIHSGLSKQQLHQHQLLGRGHSLSGSLSSSRGSEIQLMVGRDASSKSGAVPFRRRAHSSGSSSLSSRSRASSTGSRPRRARAESNPLSSSLSPPTPHLVHFHRRRSSAASDKSDSHARPSHSPLAVSQTVHTDAEAAPEELARGRSRSLNSALASEQGSLLPTHAEDVVTEPTGTSAHKPHKKHISAHPVLNAPPSTSTGDSGRSSDTAGLAATRVERPASPATLMTLRQLGARSKSPKPPATHGLAGQAPAPPRITSPRLPSRHAGSAASGRLIGAHHPLQLHHHRHRQHRGHRRQQSLDAAFLFHQIQAYDSAHNERSKRNSAWTEGSAISLGMAAVPPPPSSSSSHGRSSVGFISEMPSRLTASSRSMSSSTPTLLGSAGPSANGHNPHHYHHHQQPHLQHAQYGFRQHRSPPNVPPTHFGTGGGSARASVRSSPGSGNSSMQAKQPRSSSPPPTRNESATAGVFRHASSPPGRNRPPSTETSPPGRLHADVAGTRHSYHADYRANVGRATLRHAVPAFRSSSRTSRDRNRSNRSSAQMSPDNCTSPPPKLLETPPISAAASPPSHRSRAKAPTAVHSQPTSRRASTADLAPSSAGPGSEHGSLSRSNSSGGRRHSTGSKQGSGKRGSKTSSFRAGIRKLLSVFRPPASPATADAAVDTNDDDDGRCPDEVNDDIEAQVVAMRELSVVGEPELHGQQSQPSGQHGSQPTMSSAARSSEAGLASSPKLNRGSSRAVRRRTSNTHAEPASSAISMPSSRTGSQSPPGNRRLQLFRHSSSGPRIPLRIEERVETSTDSQHRSLPESRRSSEPQLSGAARLNQSNNTSDTSSPAAASLNSSVARESEV